jgi:WD40 repeat protein
MKRRLTCLAIGILSFILMSGLHSNVLAAQAASVGVLTVVQQNEQIYFYSISPAGSATLSASLPPEFRLGQPTTQDVWFVSDLRRIAASPDGTIIAFTAQRGEENALFLYTLAQNTLQTVTIQPTLQPLWSPDGGAILLSVCSCGLDGDPYSDRDYVYELASGQLFPITASGSHGGYYIWLDDSSALVYMEANGVYFISRHGDIIRSLVEFMSPPSPHTVLYICGLIWSEVNQRFYYVLGCVGGGDEPYEYIYSVDLAGNNRAEISDSLPTLFPDDYDVDMVNLHPITAGDGVYVVLSSSDNSIQPDGLIRWRILRVSQGQIETVYENRLVDDLTGSAISPDGQKMLLLAAAYGTGGEGFLNVVDLTTGQELVQSDLNGLGLCDAQWIDSQTILYSADPQRQCDLDAATSPEDFWLLDVTAHSTTNIGASISLPNHDT